MKFSRTFAILTILVFLLLRLTLSEEETKTVTDNSTLKVKNWTTKFEKTLSESVLNSDLLRNLDLSNIFQEASNEIGLPFALRQNLIETLREKGLLNLKGASLLLQPSDDQSSPRDYGGGGGCNDSFAVFGFLAFLLALVDLLIQLGVIMTGGRRKRGSERWESISENSCHQEYRQIALKEGTMASYSLLRGFLNAMDAQDPVCSNRFICEATAEAAKLGQTGRSFAKVASPNAKSWLEHIDPSLHSGTEAAALMGLELETTGKTCQDLFPCYDVPKSYKFPGFKETL